MNSDPIELKCPRATMLDELITLLRQINERVPPPPPLPNEGRIARHGYRGEAYPAAVIPRLGEDRIELAVIAEDLREYRFLISHDHARFLMAALQDAQYQLVVYVPPAPKSA